MSYAEYQCWLCGYWFKRNTSSDYDFLEYSETGQNGCRTCREAKKLGFKDRYEMMNYSESLNEIHKEMNASKPTFKQELDKLFERYKFLKVHS